MPGKARGEAPSLKRKRFSLVIIGCCIFFAAAFAIFLFKDTLEELPGILHGAPSASSPPARQNATAHTPPPAETAQAPAAPQPNRSREEAPAPVSGGEAPSTGMGPATSEPPSDFPAKENKAAESPYHYIPPASPFAGKSLEETAALLTKEFQGRVPSQWAEHMPGITSHLPPSAEGEAPRVAVTLDACTGKGEPTYDAGLIDFLRREGIPASLFVTSRWIKGHEAVLQELAADPLFEIAAHGRGHRPASVGGNSAYGIKGTVSVADLVSEAEGNARDIESRTGVRPRWFRAGTAFYDETAVAVLRRLGFSIAGYTIAADEGATLPAAQVRSKVLSAKDGDILLLHFNHPKSGTREGLGAGLAELRRKGYRFVRLSEITADGRTE